MQFVRTKKLVFCNNKGGVGKTTLAFNCACSFAQQGYKVVLVDLDPQTNLTRLALGEGYFEENLFSKSQNDIYNVLKGIIEGGKDVNKDIQFTKTKIENLLILPGNLNLSQFEDSLLTYYNRATSGDNLGYFGVSAIDRFLNHKGIFEKIDIFIIDTSPSLSLLNRAIFLGSDYFVVPMMPDSFSVQGIENLGKTFTKWKQEWENTAAAMAQIREIPSDRLLNGKGIFIGYAINNYNVYNKKPINNHEKWMVEIPQKVKKFLSEKHCRNGLVEKSWKNPLGKTQDYGLLSAYTHEKNIGIINLTEQEVLKFKLGTKEVFEKSVEQINNLSKNILNILKDY